MTDREELAQLHDEANRAEFAIRREERDITDELAQLDDDGQRLGQAEENAKQEIGAELRKEHWGRDPERPLTWEEHDDRGE